MYCKGEMQKGSAPMHVDRPGCHLTLDNVPAFVCSQCGEAYFEGEAVDALQDLIRSIEQRSAALIGG
jgi:YgiT-type zinc finger domain-containing protein